MQLTLDANITIDFLMNFNIISEESYVSRNSGIKITPTPRKSGSKMFVAQSLPMAVPIFNQRNDDDYEEVCICYACMLHVNIN